jgi:hypothetical protein
MWDEDEDFGFDEGSDVDNWEAEACFQDQVLEAQQDTGETNCPNQQDWDVADELDAFEDF